MIGSYLHLRDVRVVVLDLIAVPRCPFFDIGFDERATKGECVSSLLRKGPPECLPSHAPPFACPACIIL